MEGADVIHLLIRTATIKTIRQGLDLQGLQNAKMTYSLHGNLGSYSNIIS